MTQDGRVRRTYQAPTVTDFGKVSVVTAELGMTMITDLAFTGSMEPMGVGLLSGMGMGMGMS